MRISPWFLALIGIFFYPRDATSFDLDFFVQFGTALAVVTLSVLWHEFGHAFAMRRYGYRPSIELYGLGGRTMWGRGPRQPTAMQRVWVSLAGPLAGFALGAPFLVATLAARTGIAAVDEALSLLALVNIGWGILNLVPMVPWDGGHIVYGLLDRLTDGKGRRPAAIVTIITAVLAGALALFALGSLWLAFLCGLSLMEGLRLLRLRPAPPPTAESVQESLDLARGVFESLGRPADLVAAVMLKGVRPELSELADHLERVVYPNCDHPDRRALALELIGWGRLLAGDVESAAEVVERMRETHDPSPTLDALLWLRIDATQVASGSSDDAALGPMRVAVNEIDETSARTRLAAYVEAAEGNLEQALETVGDDHAAGSLVGAALYHAGRYDQSAALEEKIFERWGAAEDAYNAACSHARALRDETALGWLERAVDAGYRDLAHIEADEDLVDVRRTSGFQMLRDRLR